jgi:hypothetical protein
VEDYASALQVWLSFTRFMLELHEDWDDHDDAERDRRADTAQVKGRVWVETVRAHSKQTCNHYYCHLVFAHLAMLIRVNGHPFAGDDAVLERGHQVFKHLRKISSAGGKVRVGGKRAIQTSERSTRVDGVISNTSVRVVQSAARVLQEEQIGRLARVLTQRRASRPAAVISDAVRATAVRKSAARAGIKAESVRVLARAAGASH